jgi:hypothetical protein
MAMAVTKGVLKSVRMANLRLRIRALDEPRYGGVYRLGRNARGFARAIAAESDLGELRRHSVLASGRRRRKGPPVADIVQFDLFAATY